MVDYIPGKDYSVIVHGAGYLVSPVVSAEAGKLLKEFWNLGVDDPTQDMHLMRAIARQTSVVGGSSAEDSTVLAGIQCSEESLAQITEALHQLGWKEK